MVALPGVGHMLGRGEDDKKAARVFSVAATQRFVWGWAEMVYFVCDSDG